MRFAHGTTHNRAMARETAPVKEGVSFGEFLEFESASQVKQYMFLENVHSVVPSFRYERPRRYSRECVWDGVQPIR